VRRIVVLCLVVSAAVLVGLTVRPTPAHALSTCGSGLQKPRTYQHIIVIMHENHSFGHIIGDSNAPYLNAIARNCGLATNYHSTAHLSYEDYSAATSGFNYPSRRGPTIFRQLARHGMTWGTYSQAMPSNCLKTDAYPYESGHNPATHYRLAGCSTRALRTGSPYSGPFDTALRHHRLPNFVWLVPDKCHDMHDNCYGNAVLTADRWTKAWVKRITGSRMYQRGRTAIFITWDEGWKPHLNSLAGWDCYDHLSDVSCHVATIVISPYTPHGRRSSAFFSHYSLLKTFERMFGFRGFLGHAADRSSVSMRRAFHL
jgi:phospholipase C